VTDTLDLPQGTLDLLILKTLALGPRHGWSISERIQQISSDVLRMQQGSLSEPGLSKPSGLLRRIDEGRSRWSGSSTASKPLCTSG